MLTFFSVVLAAIIFEYSNGFHDAANAIATVVSTRVLTPRKAIAMAAFFNLTGALLGGAVASTIGKGLVDTNVVTMSTVLCALIAAFAWNIATWCAGFIFGGLLMFLLFAALHRFTPHFVNTLFGKLQIFSAAWMAHSHGSNDAQKTMGIIALALFTGTKAGNFDHLPGWLGFLKTPTFALPAWVIGLCAATMAVGTAAGGWRIIRTLGHRMVKLQPVHGFAAETSAALIIQAASYYGIPLSSWA